MRSALTHHTEQHTGRPADQLDRRPSPTPESQVIDNHFGAIAQRTFADAINTSPPIVAQRKLAEAIHTSPVMVARRQQLGAMFGMAAQLKGPENEELLQGKFAPVQQVEDEELLQGRFIPVQRVEEEDRLQGKFEGWASAQLKQEAPRPNNTRLPDQLKAGIESLSGLDMSNVRVQPTMQMKDGVPVNDDKGLEAEADVMGGKAAEHSASRGAIRAEIQPVGICPIQRVSAFNVKSQLQSDTTYWPIYLKWYNHVGASAVTELLEPLENIDAVKKMLDEFNSSEKVEMTPLELSRRDLVQGYGKNAVFLALVAGLDLSVSAAINLAKLLNNFKSAGPTHFDYVMSATDKTKFLGGTTGGDCNTVVRTFQWIAKDYLGIDTEYKTSKSIGFNCRFTAPKMGTIDGKTGNVDGGDFWLFDNHYWVEHGSQKYDVLFGKLGVDTGGWVKEVGKSDNPSFFGARKIWTTGKVTPLGDRYTTTEPKQ